MLFKKFKFKSRDVAARLKLSSITATSVWDTYYHAYADALNAIMEEGLNKSYPYNQNGRAILFLMRHCLELQMKAEAVRRKLTMVNSHNFLDIAAPFGGISALPAELQYLIGMVDKDFDGSCYRYARDPSTGNLFFPNGTQIDTSKFFKVHTQMVKAEIWGARSISPNMDFDNKGQIWDLTFHMGECNTMWRIRAQFNGLIEVLLGKIIGGKIEIQQVYIPLLFMIRHSLELVLKANVADADHYMPGINSLNLKREHKLTQVLYAYSEFLNSLDLRKMPKPTRKKLARFRKKYDVLNNTLHQLDVHSRIFRFPTDKQGKLQVIPTQRINMKRIVELLYHTNSFLTFTDLVLEDYGILGPAPTKKYVLMKNRLKRRYNGYMFRKK
jgi:hypothetical protein